MRGQAVAAADSAVGAGFGSDASKAASSFRNSTGKSTTAGRTFKLCSKERVAATPSCIAAATITSTPGKPTLAASFANSGHLTRPLTRTEFNARYIWRLGVNCRPYPGSTAEPAKGRPAASFRASRLENRLMTCLVYTGGLHSTDANVSTQQTFGKLTRDSAV